jgi:ring-1,2-phenylacetyl-CoA epoxidase subunit PaaA
MMMTALLPRSIDAFHLPAEPGYRETLLRLLAAHALAEKATGLGFARALPGLAGYRRQHAIAKNVLEELDHARLVYDLLADLGVAEAAADALVAAAWQAPSFDAPRAFATTDGDFVDVLLAGFCLDTGGLLMIGRNYAVSSYRPHAEAADAILRDERDHDAFATAEFRRAVDERGAATVQQKVDVWIPRGLNFFGPPHSRFTAACRAFGLKAVDNSELADEFRRIVERRLTEVDLRMPRMTATYPHRVLLPFA